MCVYIGSINDWFDFHLHPSQDNVIGIILYYTSNIAGKLNYFKHNMTWNMTWILILIVSE